MGAVDEHCRSAGFERKESRLEIHHVADALRTCVEMARTGEKEDPGQHGASDERQLGSFPSFLDPKLGHVRRLTRKMSRLPPPFRHNGRRTSARPACARINWLPLRMHHGLHDSQRYWD